MAVDKKISQLASGAPAQAGDEYVVARSGANYKLTLTNIAASMPPIGATTPNTGAFTTLSATGNSNFATSSGNVGIGTASPVSCAGYTILTVNNSTTGGGIYLQNNGTSVGAASVNSGGMTMGTVNNTPWLFITNATERMRIDSSGNVGIGTASPSRKLEVGLLGAFRLQTGSVTMDCTPTAGATDSFVWNTSANAIYSWQMAGTERMRIDSSGNVGIGGTADANVKTQIKGTLPTSSNTSIGIASSGTSPSGSTSAAYGFLSNFSTAAASFTLTDQLHFYANPVAKGAGSTIGNQYGFFASSGLTEATNNFGFYSNIASGSNRFNFYAAGTAQNYFAGNVNVGADGNGLARLYVVGSGSTSATNNFVFRNSSNNNVLYARNDGAINTGLLATSPYNLTTAGAADAVLGADGFLYRSTSSLRYKSDVTDATHGLADVLKLRSVTYKGKNDGDTVFGGLIAEEVHDAGLTEFVKYDKEGRPDAIHYGNMVALLVKAVQELTARVAELEAK
jgi:hypothetical protein